MAENDIGLRLVVDNSAEMDVTGQFRPATISSENDPRNPNVRRQTAQCEAAGSKED